MQALKRGAILFGAGFALLALAPSALAGGPYQYFAITPCRSVDTRTGFGGPVSSGVANIRSWTIKGVCGVPVDAQAVSLNVTVIDPTSDGYFSFWPVGSSPNSSTLNFVANEPALANGAIFPLAAGTPDLSSFYGTPVALTPPATANLLLDVTGYFK